MYSIIRGIACINGAYGAYDDKVKNPSVRYGRNAMNNYVTYLADLSDPKKNVTERSIVKYMPNKVENGNIDKMALMGEAYEELGGRTSVDVDKFSEFLQIGNGKDVSADAIDLNGDKRIDLGEYSASVLLSDMLSTDSKNLKMSNINGTITDRGQDALLPYGYKKNYEIANNTYRALYETYKLGEAAKDFQKDPNNMVE